MSAPYLGDYVPGNVVRFMWNSADSNGASITRSTNGTISVYKDLGLTQSTSGVTDTEDIDGLTGVHGVAIDTSSDGTFYSAGSDFQVVLSAATIDTRTVNAVIGHFSLSFRSALRPTTATRTLDVSAGGEAGVDWANVGSQSTSVNLSATTTNVVNTATAVTTVNGLAANVITATAIAADAITAAKVADGTIDAATFAASAITATAIASDAITAAKIADGAIDAATLAAGTITAAKFAAGAIDAAAIADGAIDAATFAAGAITATVIADGAIDAATLAAGTITAAKFGAGAIDATAIADGAIDAATFAAGAINATVVADGTIDAATFAAGAIDATAIAANAITSSEFAQSAADKVFGSGGAAMAELAQGTPTATPRPDQALMALYMALRNLTQVTATEKRVTNDAGTVIFKKALTDDGTTYTEAEAVTGP